MRSPGFHPQCAEKLNKIPQAYIPLYPAQGRVQPGPPPTPGASAELTLWEAATTPLPRADASTHHTQGSQVPHSPGAPKPSLTGEGPCAPKHKASSMAGLAAWGQWPGHASWHCHLPLPQALVTQTGPKQRQPPTTSSQPLGLASTMKVAVGVGSGEMVPGHLCYRRPQASKPGGSVDTPSLQEGPDSQTTQLPPWACSRTAM